ncbi:hypothetical protein D3C73_1460500 [compost metagenome]
MQLGLAQEAVFLQFRLNQPEGQSGGIYRNIQLFEKIGNSPYVIFMSMRHHKGFDFVCIAEQVRNIRNDKVNPQ